MFPMQLDTYFILKYKYDTLDEKGIQIFYPSKLLTLTSHTLFPPKELEIWLHISPRR